MLEFADFERVGPQRGSNRGGVFQRQRGGSKWYLKHPSSERQAHNEVMAAKFYRMMGFDAVDYHLVDNGMVASQWRDDLPTSSRPADLRNSDVVQEAFLPSALVANWDVIGLEYDNCIYDPSSMVEPVFLDFGGSFDTRAMGGAKQFTATEILAIDGFTDPSINRSASTVFDGMTNLHFNRGQDRVESLTRSEIESTVNRVPLRDAHRRVERLLSRRDVILSLDYSDVA